MALPASDEIINWGIAHTEALEWTNHPRMESIRMRLRNFALTLASFRTPEIASIFRSIPEQGFYNLYNVLDIHEHQQARRALREGWHEMGVIQQAQYRPYQSSSVTSSIGIGRFHRISGRFH